MKQQINFRASDLTASQLEELAERWGTTQSETVAIAIDRAYQQEKQRMVQPTPHMYLLPELRTWLRTPAASALVAGQGGNADDDETVTLLDLKLAPDAEGRVLVTNPITQASRKRLAALIANPDQPVCVDPEHRHGACGRIHVDEAAVERPTVMAMVRAHEMDDPADVQKYAGLHNHGTVRILRDHGGAEWAEWSDHEPTKGGAWNLSELVDLDEARRLVWQKARGRS